VDFLVSTDSDLTDVDETTEKLRQAIAPGRVLKVGTFLNEIMGWTHDALDAIARRLWDELSTDVWGPDEGDTD